MCNSNTIAFQRGRNAGYTLIELAVIMIIVGMLVAPLAQGYNIYVKKQQIETTQNNVDLVTSKIGEFRAAFGRYPCPAPLNSQRTNVQFGHETDCEDTSVAVGACAGGICTQESDRTVGGATPRVRVGAVPFRELNISDSNAVDGYGNRLMYVVTEDLAVRETFNLSNGGIDIRDSQATAESMIEPPASAHFVLLSPGKNGAGAYSRDGIHKGIPCPSVGAESLNCINGSTISPKAIYRQAQSNSSTSNQQFDDLISFSTQGDVTPWKLAEDNSGNSLLRNVSTKVGVMNEDVDKDERLILGGTGIARAQENLQVSELCNGDDCTFASVIGGPVNGVVDDYIGLECPPGQYMTGISNNLADCSNEVFIACKDGEILKSINPDGTINCSSVAPGTCYSKNVALCSSAITIPDLLDGESYTAKAGNAEVKYTCIDGNLSKGAMSGACDCVEETVCDILDCRKAWGDVYRGDISECSRRVCPKGNFVWDDSSRYNCTCVADMYHDYKISCPSGQTGYIRIQKQMTCINGKVNWGPETRTNACTPIENYCTVQAPITEEITCTGGSKITRKKTHSCPSNTWSDWVYSGSCPNSCDPNQYQEDEPDPCPSGYTGGPLVERRYMQCPSGTWGDWEPYSGKCKPSGNATCTWTAGGGSVQGSSNNSSNKVGSSCDCGSPPAKCYKGAGPYINYGSCNCGS